MTDFHPFPGFDPQCFDPGRSHSKSMSLHMLHFAMWHVLGSNQPIAARTEGQHHHLRFYHHSSWPVTRLLEKQTENQDLVRVESPNPLVFQNRTIFIVVSRNLQWQKVSAFLRQLETNELRNNEITYSAAIVSCELATHEAAENKDPTAVCKHQMWQKNRLTLLWARVEERDNEVYTAVWLIWPCLAFDENDFELRSFATSPDIPNSSELKLALSRFSKASGRLLPCWTQTWQSWFTCSTCSDLFSRSLARSSTVLWLETVDT